MENILQQEAIPTYEFVLSKKDSQLFGISLVKSPAFQSEFILMQEESLHEFQIQNEEKRIITGAVLIPGKPVERLSKSIGLFNGWFSKETIRQLVYNSIQSGEFLNKFSFNHNGEEVKGLYVIESWFVDSQNDKTKGLNLNLPADTYMMSLYVPDLEQWNDIKKKGLKGFSIEIRIDNLDLVPSDSKTAQNNFKSISTIQIKNMEEKTLMQNIKAGLLEIVNEIAGKKPEVKPDEKVDNKEMEKLAIQTPSEIDSLKGLISDLQSRLQGYEEKLSESEKSISSANESQIKMNSVLEKMSALVQKIADTPTGEPVQKTETSTSTTKYNAKEDGIKNFSSYLNKK